MYKRQDLELHLEALNLLPEAASLIAPVDQRLRQAADKALGLDWMGTWSVGLPPWYATPGEINLPVLLWLYNLLEAWDLDSYAKARYGLLGSGGHWFAGSNADGFDGEVSAEELQSVLQESPWRERIPEILRSLKQRLKGESQMRLSSV